MLVHASLSQCEEATGRTSADSVAYPPVDSLRSGPLRSASENAGALTGNVPSHVALDTRD